jgi:membrane-associated phospholipid phosphatase
LKFGDELINLHGKSITVARAVSRATPAPLINFYVGIIFSWYSPIGLGPVLTPQGSFLLCVLLMVISPILPILYEAAKGKIDLDVSERESRTRFFLFSLFCYIFAYTIYSMLNCTVMSSLAAAYFTVTLGVTIASLKTKVSVHGAGVGGPGTALIFVFGISATPVIILWAAVVWARMTLKQHSMIQSVGGVLLGVIITLLTYPFVYFS